MRKSACFTGHRTIKTDMNSFSALLLSVIEQMITDRNGTLPTIMPAEHTDLMQWLHYPSCG